MIYDSLMFLEKVYIKKMSEISILLLKIIKAKYLLTLFLKLILNY